MNRAAPESGVSKAFAATLLEHNYFGVVYSSFGERDTSNAFIPFLSTLSNSDTSSSTALQPTKCGLIASARLRRRLRTWQREFARSVHAICKMDILLLEVTRKRIDLRAQSNKEHHTKAEPLGPQEKDDFIDKELKKMDKMKANRNGITHLEGHLMVATQKDSVPFEAPRHPKLKAKFFEPELSP